MDLSTKRYVTIEGNEVTVRREAIEKKIALDDFVKDLQRQAPMNTGVLPRNCVYYGRSLSTVGKSLELFVTYRPPTPLKFSRLFKAEGDYEQEDNETTEDWMERRRRTYLLSVPHFY